MLNKLHKLGDRGIVAKNLVELVRQAQGAWWDLARPSAPPPVFLVCCSRSGTTITFETLGASQQLVNLGFEIPQFWSELYDPRNNGWHSEAAGAGNARPEHRDAAQRFFYQRLGSGRVLDKTCINVMRVGYLHALFPEAKFVFIQRDGRDNISSMIDSWRLGRTDGNFHLSQFLGDFPRAGVAQRAGSPEVLIVDDTHFPKKGRHSVGVSRQYCGQLGKQDNCQVAVSVSVANEAFSLPVGWRLYLHESWAGDAQRRRKAKVPEDIEFATKPQIALQLIEQERARRDSPRIVLADAGYGADTAFRDRLAAWGLQYVVGVTGAVSLWPPRQAPLAAPTWAGRGRPPKLLQRDDTHKPVSAKALALQLPWQKYRTVSWREGSNAPLSGRFAAIRVRDRERTEPHPEQWFLIEWPSEETEPTKYFLSTLPSSTPLRELVRLAKLRWRIERDYQDLKQEFGLGHFEGAAGEASIITPRCALPPMDS